MPKELRGPPKVLSGDGHSFSDVAQEGGVDHQSRLGGGRWKMRAGAPVDPLRFRGNRLCRGWPAWHEFDLLGREIAIGDARLKVVKRIQRCAATDVDPETGIRDLTIPRTLMDNFGHADCGIYAEVIAAGEIGAGDASMWRRDCGRHISTSKKAPCRSGAGAFAICLNASVISRPASRRR